MYKLSIKLGSFLLFGLMLMHGLAWIAKTYAPDGTATFLSIDQKNIDQVLDNRNEVEVLVLGNSHGDDIDISAFSKNGYQLSRAWGDFFEIDQYLDYLVPRLPNLKLVFISVSYFSFTWDNASTERLAVRRSQFYQVFPSLTLIDGDVRNFIDGKINRMFPVKTIVREDNWKGVFYSIINGKKDSNDPLIVNNKDCGSLTEQELIKISKGRVKDTISVSKEIQEKRKTITDDTYAKTVEIISLLQSHNITVVFFTPPYFHEYSLEYKKHNPEAIELMEKNMEKLIADYNVKYYNFSDHPNYSHNYQLFKDSDHLNICGQTLFSKDISERMVSFHP